MVSPVQQARATAQCNSPPTAPSPVPPPVPMASPDCPRPAKALTLSRTPQARKTAMTHSPVDPVDLTRQLVRCPSVTPAEGGALAALGSEVKS